MELNQKILKEYVSYCPTTGIFTLIKARSQSDVSNVGKELGHEEGRGYIHFSLLGKKYKAHRLAWLYVHGVWPKKIIDHINANKKDNRISNLREVDHTQNQQNRTKPTSLSGYKGVYPDRNKNGDIVAWTAQYNKIHLGTFKTKEDAAESYDNYVSRFGEYAATNTRILELMNEKI